MPSAWEEPSLSHNLGVLARLATKPVGTKLKFDSDSGRFDIDERYLISRTFSWDSVTSESHFATPMGRLLRTALDSVELDPALDAQLWDYLVMAAHSLVNVVPENLPGPSGRGDLGITPA